MVAVRSNIISRYLTKTTLIVSKGRVGEDLDTIVLWLPRITPCLQGAKHMGVHALLIMCFPNCRMSCTLKRFHQILKTPRYSIMSPFPFRASHALSSLGFPPTVAKPISQVILPSNTPIEEELVPGYDPRHFLSSESW